jgi:phenylalanyl-tRNA synthetase beta chain
MNILIPHHWLLEHLKTEASPKKIQEYLSLCGPSVERINKSGAESVYDVEVTTNRVDAMSVQGIAREAAVILPQFDVPAKFIKQNLTFASIKPTAGKLLPLPIIRNSAKLSNRIVCVILSDLKRTPTPKWMADRLTQVGMNIHDSAIDITNYITHELGHPVHAFDYDKIMALGGEIIVTKARKGEKFTTLDGEKYQTAGGEVVFKNPDGKIIDLPAVKGTLNSSVDDQTKNILLWLESIDPAKVRFASMTHAIRTVAAQLAEKGVDPSLMEPTLVRGIKLYQDLCEAKIASEIYDAFPRKITPQPVAIDLSKIQNYLGLELPMSKIANILEKLEFQVKTLKHTLQVTPPTFRQDIAIPADIIEEIARVYGYHNLPSVVMPTRIPLNQPTDVNFTAENTIKYFLAYVGWQETYTYSMVSEKLALETGFSLKDHHKLANALTEDKVYLRRSLIPSLKEVIEANPLLIKLSVFELANVYLPRQGSLPQEDLRLTLVSTKPYREVIGDLAVLLKQFYLSDLSVKLAEDFNHGALFVGKTKLGLVAVNQQYTSVEIELSALLPLLKTHPNYQPLPKTASVIEHMTFTLPSQTNLGPLLSAVKALDRRIKSVTLRDTYRANHTFSLEYWDQRRNLTNEAVRPIRKQIIKLLKKAYRGKLVGALQ